MNKLLIVALRMAIITFLLTSVDVIGYSHTTPSTESAHNSTIPSFSDQDIKDRLENISSVIDLNYTSEVGRRIREYTVDYRISGERILGRVDLYFPLFEQEIQERNLPDELKFVAVVESNLEPTARSKSGALGLWQFIKSTGKMQGLKMNKYVDERRDPIKSTAAALDYLASLYESFDDWTLAIAAYNCGPGNVRKAIRRGNSKNYWDIRKHLPRETQKYVPRIIAAIYLMQYYHYHNLSPEPMHKDIVNTISINDGKRHNFRQLAKELEVDYTTIKYLNPQFKTEYIPENEGHYSLLIPVSKYELYLKHHDELSYNKMLETRAQKSLERKKEIRRLKRSRRVEDLIKIQVIEPQIIYSYNIKPSVNISL